MSGITNIKYISSFKLGDQVVLDDRKPYEGLEDLGMLPEGTSLYIEEYTRQFDLDVSDLDTEDAPQL